jgi:hypothetical protein
MSSHLLRRWLPLAGVLVLFGTPAGVRSEAPQLPRVAKVERQPLAAQVQRVVEALDLLGAPLPAADRKALQSAIDLADDARAVDAIQAVLDTHCLAGVRVADGKVTTQGGPARPELAEQGWRIFLVKVENPGGLHDVELRAESPNALPLYRQSSGKADPRVTSVGEVPRRFLDL